MVTVETVMAEDLERKIQEAKDQGRRILAVSPSNLTKIGRITKEFKVSAYVLATQ